eukprot:658295-Hanusia_phi.AAC.1
MDQNLHLTSQRLHRKLLLTGQRKQKYVEISISSLPHPHPRSPPLSISSFALSPSSPTSPALSSLLLLSSLRPPAFSYLPQAKAQSILQQKKDQANNPPQNANNTKQLRDAERKNRQLEAANSKLQQKVSE